MFAVVGFAAVFWDVVVGAELDLNFEGGVFQQLNHLGAGEEDGAITVEGAGADGAGIIVGLVAGEGCAYARAFDGAFFGDFCCDARPAGLGDRAVSRGADPALVDRVGDAVNEHGRGGGFQVGIVSVEHLVPEAGAGLVLADAA